MLSSLGLDRVPYLVGAVQAAWRVGLVLVLAWLAWAVCSRLISIARTRLTARATDADNAKQITTMTHVFRYIAGVVISIVAVMLVLGELGISVLPILATAGVAGIAIGFGAQSLIKDYFNGFFLLLEDQIRQGDVVEIAGKEGTVEEITLRHVRLRDFDGNVYFVPNSEIKLVVNRTRGHALAVIDAVVKSSQKVDEAFALMRGVGAALRSDPAFRASILDDAEISGIERWEPWGLVLRCRMRVAPHAQWSVRAEFLRRLKSEFEARGIQSP